MHHLGQEGGGFALAERIGKGIVQAYDLPLQHHCGRPALNHMQNLAVGSYGGSTPGREV